jgi:hypothetical protein
MASLNASADFTVKRSGLSICATQQTLRLGSWCHSTRFGNGAPTRPPQAQRRCRTRPAEPARSGRRNGAETDLDPPFVQPALRPPLPRSTARRSLGPRCTVRAPSSCSPSPPAVACRAPDRPDGRDSLFAEAMIELRRRPGSTTGRQRRPARGAGPAAPHRRLARGDGGGARPRPGARSASVAPHRGGFADAARSDPAGDPRLGAETRATVASPPTCEAPHRRRGASSTTSRSPSS